MIAVGGPFRPQRVQIRAGRRSASDVSGGRRIESKGTCTVRSQWAHETMSEPCRACFACAIVGAGWRWGSSDWLTAPCLSTTER